MARMTLLLAFCFSPFTQTLLFGFQPPIAAVAQPKPPKHDVILVTLVDSTLSGAKIDSDGMKEAFVQGTAATDAFLVGPKEFPIEPAATINLQKLEDFINSITIQPGREADTTIVCYCKLHGAMLGVLPDSTEREHLLALGLGGKRPLIERSHLLNLLQEHNAGLTVLITDSCTGTDSRFAELGHLGPHGQSFKSLFLDSKGIVDINGSSPTPSREEFAFTTFDGGIFTQAFLRELSRNDVKVRGWRDFFTAVQLSTFKSFIELRKMGNEQSNDAALRVLARQPGQVPAIMGNRRLPENVN